MPISSVLTARNSLFRIKLKRVSFTVIYFLLLNHGLISRAVDYTKNPYIGTFATPTNIIGFPVKVPTTTAPVLTVFNANNTGRLLKFTWICTTCKTADVTVVFNFIKNGNLFANGGAALYLGYSQYFTQLQASAASLNTNATAITNGTLVWATFLSGQRSENIVLPATDQMMLLPGEQLTVVANTLGGTAEINLSLTWQEFALQHKK